MAGGGGAMRSGLTAAHAGCPGRLAGCWCVTKRLSGSRRRPLTPASKRSFTACRGPAQRAERRQRTFLGDIAGAGRDTGELLPSRRRPRRRRRRRRRRRKRRRGPPPRRRLPPRRAPRHRRPPTRRRQDPSPPQRRRRAAARRRSGRWRCPARRSTSPSNDSAARIRVSASLIVGGLLKPVGELPEDRRADADDDGQHQDLDAGRDDVAEHLLGEKGGAAEEAERHQHEARQGRQLEFEEADEELDRHDEEADDDDQPGEQQDHDLDEVVEERDKAGEARDRGEDRLAGGRCRSGRVGPAAIAAPGSRCRRRLRGRARRTS